MVWCQTPRGTDGTKREKMDGGREREREKK